MIKNIYRKFILWLCKPILDKHILVLQQAYRVSHLEIARDERTALIIGKEISEKLKDNIFREMLRRKLLTVTQETDIVSKQEEFRIKIRIWI